MNDKKKTVTKQKNSTLAIDANTSEKLDLFCRKHAITKKEFVLMALAYFERTGVDPRSNDIATDMHDIKQQLETIVRLQVDTSLKITGVSENTKKLTQIQEDTNKLLEDKKEAKKRFGWF